MIQTEESSITTGFTVRYYNAQNHPIGRALIERHNQGKPWCRLYSVFIDQESRNQGNGSTMIAEIIDHCRTIGIERIELFVEPENQRAIHVYKKHGFIMKIPDTNNCGDCSSCRLFDTSNGLCKLYELTMLLEIEKGVK